MFIKKVSAAAGLLALSVSLMDGCGDKSTGPEGNVNRSDLVLPNGQAWVYSVTAGGETYHRGVILRNDNTVILIGMFEGKWYADGEGTWDLDVSQLTISIASGQFQGTLVGTVASKNQITTIDPEFNQPVTLAPQVVGTIHSGGGVDDPSCSVGPDGSVNCDGVEVGSLVLPDGEAWVYPGYDNWPGGYDGWSDLGFIFHANKTWSYVYGYSCVVEGRLIMVTPNEAEYSVTEDILTMVSEAIPPEHIPGYVPDIATMSFQFDISGNILTLIGRDVIEGQLILKRASVPNLTIPDDNGDINVSCGSNGALSGRGI